MKWYYKLQIWLLKRSLDSLYEALEHQIISPYEYKKEYLKIQNRIDLIKAKKKL